MQALVWLRLGYSKTNLNKHWIKKQQHLALIDNKNENNFN